MGVRAVVVAGLAAAAVMTAGNAAAAPDPVLDRQAAAYAADTAKTIFDLQPFRRTEQQGGATLVNINPAINRWFILTLDTPGGDPRGYHLENPDPRGQQVHLLASGLRLVRGEGGKGAATVDCSLLGGTDPAPLPTAQRSGLPYAPLCDGRLYLRNRVSGHASALERVTDMLRDNLWGGDAIVSFVRRQFYADRFLERGQAGGAAVSVAEPAVPGAPLPALLRPAGDDDAALVTTYLRIELAAPPGGLLPGRWYPASGLPGIFVSSVLPGRVAPQGIEHVALNPMDPVEGGALGYFIAFDLGRFDLGFAVGTSHPRVNWSDRPPASVRDDLPGPDGIASVAPLVTNGMVAPWLAGRTVATFTGGFKREHGAFKYGKLAAVNHGSHYGFIEHGAILSKLQPGVSTVYVLDDGSIGMKTWTEADNALLPRIVDARQNGTPLIEYDPASGASRPGPLVAAWGPGNWSGTAEEKLRSLRAGACLQETPGGGRFLIYGYFSAATPSTMARVFQAYRCRYAMHLDMNALEHTYLALYRGDGGRLEVEHLVNGMETVDASGDQGVLPRFLMMPDDRDFFYLTRKETTR